MYAAYILIYIIRTVIKSISQEIRNRAASRGIYFCTKNAEGKNGFSNVYIYAHKIPMYPYKYIISRRPGNGIYTALPRHFKSVNLRTTSCSTSYILYSPI